MKQHGIDAYIVPTADAHQSEYVSEADKRRAYLSGFTGSAGTAVVLSDPFSDGLDESKYGPASVCGRVWTDGRYFLQASQQLNPKHFTLMKQGLPGTPTIEEWLLAVLKPGSRVAIDPTITSVNSYKAMRTQFKGKLELAFSEESMVDQVWGKDRPAYSTNPLIVLSESYTGESHTSKLDRARAKMLEKKAGILVVSALDAVAWLFNLRGADIPFNPVFLSYALVTADSAFLYVDGSKASDAVRSHLGSGVIVRSYTDIWTDLEVHMKNSALGADKKVWIDPAKCNAAIYAILGGTQPDTSKVGELVIEAENPIQIMKAVKNETELNGMRQAHIKDAAAVINFLSWLEDELLLKHNTELTECSVADRLESFRSEQPDFIGLSFETIAGAGPNGAIIHYKPEPETCRKVTANEMFLLDSGAQFKDGTTDITRTIHLGEPTAFMREAFTRVLQGHIQLALAIFPAGTVGPALDGFARRQLWSVGMDYAHGTGHGVGSFLNVHEGPMGISSTARSFSVLTTPLQGGMVLSNEPGYYQEGEFGIRIESLVIVQPIETKHRPFQDKQFFTFDTITLVPIQRKLIDLELLSEVELQWLNEYHRTCREKVAPLLQGKAKEWLMRETEPITRA